MANPAAPSQNRLALPDGTVVGSYRIQRMLGDGGFGITYLAEHTALARKVALKELLPPDFATRASDSTVVPRSDDTAPDMDWARQCFLNEARNLSRCEHRNVVKVYDVFEGNGTAYMAMGYEEGRTLTAWLNQLARDPTEQEVLGVLMPILDGLEKVHAIGLLHRDIKPDNLYICNDGRPVLLDFGAAREAVVTRTRPMTALVTAGYAPIEQYSTEDADDVGPASDLYALAATVYRMMVGDKPPEAPRRIRKDPYQPLTQRLAGRYSAPLLNACDHCLQVMDVDRPQSVSEMRALIQAAKAAPTMAKATTAPQQQPPPLSDALKRAREATNEPAPRTAAKPPPLPPEVAAPKPVPAKPTGPGFFRRMVSRVWRVLCWFDRAVPKLVLPVLVADGKRRTWFFWGVVMAVFYAALFVGNVTWLVGARPLSDPSFWGVVGGLALLPFLLARAPFRFLTGQQVGKPWMVFHALLLIPLWSYTILFGLYAVKALVGLSSYSSPITLMILGLGMVPVTRLVLLILGVRKHEPIEFHRRLSRGLVRVSAIIASVAFLAWAWERLSGQTFPQMPLGLVGFVLISGILGMQPRLLQGMLRLWYGPGNEPVTTVVDRGPIIRAGVVMVVSAGLVIAGPSLLTSAMRYVAPYLSWRYRDLSPLAFWSVLGGFVFFQFILLVLPFRLAMAWRVSRRSIWWPIMVSGLLMGLLIVVGTLSLAEAMHIDDAAAWPLLLVPPVWLVWGFLFARYATKRGPRAFASSQNDWLLVGSIVELMLVGFAQSPTHWSGSTTFLAVSLGLAVLLMTLGVSIYLRLDPRRKLVEQPPA